MTNGLWYVQAHTPATHLATCTNQLHLSAFLVLPNKQPRSPFYLKGAACTHHCLCGDVPKEHLSLSPPCYPQIIIKTSNKKKVSARTVLFWFFSNTLLYRLLPHTVGHDNSFSFFALFSTWEHGSCKKKRIPVGWWHLSAWLAGAPSQHGGRTMVSL